MKRLAWLLAAIAVALAMSAGCFLPDSRSTAREAGTCSLPPQLGTCYWPER